MTNPRVGTLVPQRPRTVGDKRPYRVGQKLSQFKRRLPWNLTREPYSGSDSFDAIEQAIAARWSQVLQL
jgi:hypothetical protein